MTSHGTVPYEKYHGTGNEFVVVDAADYVPDRTAFAARHCDPDGGVGADGVLFLALEDRFEPPRVVMTLVQPDGSTAAMCGNGARIAAEWAMERTGAETVMLDTQAGTRRARRVGDEIAIEMGDPAFAPDDVGLSDAYEEPMIEERILDDSNLEDSLIEGSGDGESFAGYAVTGVNTGVPHAVVFVDDVDAVDLETVAPRLRHHGAFPEGANVTFAAPCGGSGTENECRGGETASVRFRQRTYERGVEGETASCGTGAVAIAAAARECGRVDARTVRVSPPGGDLTVKLPAAGPTTAAGSIVPSRPGSNAQSSTGAPGTRSRAGTAILQGPVVQESSGVAEATVERLEPQP